MELEKLFADLVNFITGIVNSLFGTALTTGQMAVILVTVLIILWIVALINLQRKRRQYNRLKKQILNQQIQIVTVAKGKKGKTMRVLRTTEQLRNPKRNNKLNKKSKKKVKTKGVTNIQED